MTTASPTLRPLLITADPLLVDDVVRLAAAAGVEVVVRDDPAVSSWSGAPLVLVGADALAMTIERALPRREGVVVLRRRARGAESCAPVETWRGAVSVGAEHVVEIPDGERWIVDRIAELADASVVGGPVISCVAAVGGAGASTVAAMLAREARGLLVDVDPYGPTIPVQGGVRWPDLAATRGRIPPRSLANALPTVHSTSILTGAPDERFGVPVEALVAVLDAGARGFPCTIVDTPRGDGDATRTAWARSDLVIIIVGPEPASVARVPALVDGVREVCTEVAVVARTAPRDAGLWCAAEARDWGVAALPSVKHVRGLGQGDHILDTPRSTGRRNARALLAAVAPGAASA